MTALPYGSWPSPVQAAAAAAGSIALSDTAVVAGEVWWSEMRPDEGGRTVVVRERSDGRVEDVLPEPWSAANRLHEYGGRSWVPAPGGAIVFAHAADQRLYRLEPGGEPTPLTPEPAVPLGDRYSDYQVVGAEVLCVRERHAEGRVERALVAVALDGSGVREVARDGHFLAGPRVSPNGRHLAWVTWEHPNMPWDATALRVAPLVDGVAGEARTLLGHGAESVLQPEWADDGSLFVLSDRSGWWNLHRVTLAGDLTALCPRDEEFAGPMWGNGARWYLPLDDGRILCRHGVGTYRFGVLDPATGDLADLDLPVRHPGGHGGDGALGVEGTLVSLVAAGATSPPAVALLDLAAATSRPVRGLPAVVPAGHVPVPVSGPVGRAYGHVYAPTSPDAAAPAGERPPYVIRVHGGPHAQARPYADVWTAFLTSRGIGVLDLDYRGSTGYGRAFRQQLTGAWGLVDVVDAEEAADHLVRHHGADPDRIAVQGASAGGWTTLRAVVTSDRFACGVSLYGVADLSALATDTHDFESRYLDGLVGPWPEARERYTALSPLTHADKVRCPVLLLQGAEDPVVPPNQAERFAAAMARRGIPHAVRIFPGERHGWRREETIVAALETELAFYGAVFGFAPDGIAPLTLD